MVRMFHVKQLGDKKPALGGFYGRGGWDYSLSARAKIC